MSTMSDRPVDGAEDSIAPAASPAASRSRQFPRWFVGAILAVTALLVLVLAVAVGDGWWNREPEGLVFVIPAGMKASIAEPGFDSAITIPTDIRFAAGEPAVITVRNLDDVTHRAGPFLVGPNQTYVQRFPEPGRYPIACSVDPLESIVVTVET